LFKYFTLTGFPNGLSIDYVAERLYWVDAKLDKIETSTLDGNNRVTLIQNVPHPFGLTVVSTKKVCYIVQEDGQEFESVSMSL
jgi:hypothetical protein